MTMPVRHEEYAGAVVAAAEVFAHLDDQRRLSAHMSKRSWMMGWGKMEVRLDAREGKAVGSHIALAGRVFGIRLALDEVVTEREPPWYKRWRTVGEPRLLVVGQYTMGFDIMETDETRTTTNLRVLIDYELPSRGVPAFLGRLFGRMYARWCTRRMVHDAQRAFARGTRMNDAAPRTHETIA